MKIMRKKKDNVHAVGLCIYKGIEKPYARWWCAMKGAQKMKVGPSTGIEQANLSNHSNAAVVKPMVVSD